MDEGLTGKLLALVVVVVTIGWVTAYVVMPSLSRGFRPAPEVNLVMMAVIALFVQLYRKSKRPEGPGEDHYD